MSIVKYDVKVPLTTIPGKSETFTGPKSLLDIPVVSRIRDLIRMLSKELIGGERLCFQKNRSRTLSGIYNCRVSFKNLKYRGRSTKKGKSVYLL